jgi:ABC-2 type transport system ATP-binding protein
MGGLASRGDWHSTMSTTPEPSGIVADHLTKVYTTTVSEPGLCNTLRSLFRPVKRDTLALDDVSFTARRGELVVLLGPNGAGKSTLVKILTGIVRPTQGGVRVGGHDPSTERIRTARTIGVVFGQRSQLWWDLSIADSFTVLQNIYGLPESAFRRRLASLDEILGLSDFWDKRLRQISLGQRVRADLAGALLHEPGIVFLDEPTIGMDVGTKEKVRHLLRREVDQRGCTVLLTTHDTNEVKRLAKRVLVISDGRLSIDENLTDLVQRFSASWRLAVTLPAGAAFRQPAGVSVHSREGTMIRLVPGPDEARLTAQEALRRVVIANPVETTMVEEGDLEDVLRELFQDIQASPAAKVDS